MRLPLSHYATQTAYRRLRILASVNRFCPTCLGQAEFDNVTSLSAYSYTTGSQILITLARPGQAWANSVRIRYGTSTRGHHSLFLPWLM